MRAPFRRQFLQSTGFIAILLIGLVLSVQYLGAWYGLEILRISKESELESHLKDLGRMAPPEMLRESLALADAAYEITEGSSAASLDLAGPDSPLAEEFRVRTALTPRSQFDSFAANARLKGLHLLDDTGRILHSTSEPDRVWGTFDYLDMDREQFESALEGQTAGSLAYRSKNSPLKRVYVPVLDPDTDGVAAVLCLTAGRDFLAELDAVGEAMTALTIISTILILLIGWLVYRLLNRQKKYERQAAHADRLSSLGTLAAGFAHEVRNPLEIIGACTEDLERTLRESSAPAQTQEACRDILEEVERLNRLVGQFLQYSRADATDASGGQSSVAQSISSALAMLRHPAEKKKVSLSLSTTFASNDDRASISESALRQIIINLVLNAIQASPEDGRVEIEASADHNSIRIAVSDNGPGISSAVRARLFEPFFTTRSEGSGLGLAIAHQLARATGGSLDYLDRPGTGACFVLLLPRVGRTVASKSVATEALAGDPRS